MNRPSSAVFVFAKAPAPGKVNTRLIPAIGEQQAAQLQHDLIVHRMQQFAALDHIDVQLWCAPDTQHPLFQQCAERYAVSLQQQQGDNLGQRMMQAFRQGLQQYGRVVLVGTDAPAVGVSEIEQSIQSLQTHDVVLQPAEDGGYVLIAMRACHATVFEAVDWGSGQVMAQTRNNMIAAGLRWRELPVSWDVDTIADYQRYCREFVSA